MKKRGIREREKKEERGRERYIKKEKKNRREVIEHQILPPCRAELLPQEPRDAVQRRPVLRQPVQSIPQCHLALLDLVLRRVLARHHAAAAGQPAVAPARRLLVDELGAAEPPVVAERQRQPSAATRPLAHAAQVRP